MSGFFAWHNLLFVVPLTGGILLVAAAALGVVDLDADADVDAEADTDAESEPGDTHGVGSAAWPLLGIGRVPLSLLLMMALLLFGGTGLSSNLVLARWFSAPWQIGVVSLGLALTVTLVTTGCLARLIARFLPSTETYATSKHDLIGCTGTAELDVRPDFGVANVLDPTGTLLKVRCRTDSERLLKGSQVLLIDYDAQRDVFLVERSPL